MRKSAPVLIMTTLFALASGSALALGDRAKEKKAADGATTSSQAPSNPASSTVPSAGSPSTNAAPSSPLAQKDPRCDESKYAKRSDMPKDCLDNAAMATTNSQRASGDSGAGAASASGSSAAGASSSSGK
jgi:hypothetical protein